MNSIKLRSSGFWRLAHFTCDLYQARKKKLLLQAEQLTKSRLFSLKMTTLTILSKIVFILCISSACNKIYFLEISHLSNGPTAQNQQRCRVLQAESFYYVNYRSSIIASKVSQTISLMKT